MFDPAFIYKSQFITYTNYVLKKKHVYSFYNDDLKNYVMTSTELLYGIVLPVDCS